MTSLFIVSRWFGVMGAGAVGSLRFTAERGRLLMKLRTAIKYSSDLFLYFVVDTKVWDVPAF